MASKIVNLRVGLKFNYLSPQDRIDSNAEVVSVRPAYQFWDGTIGKGYSIQWHDDNGTIHGYRDEDWFHQCQKEGKITFLKSFKRLASWSMK